MFNPQSESIFEQLVLYPSSMPIGSLQVGSVDVGREMRVRDSSHILKLKSPWYVRDIGRVDLGKAWPNFCGLMREFGVSVCCSVEAMDGVPAAGVPVRWSRRPAVRPLDSLDLKTADSFEIECVSEQGQFVWPVELKTQTQFKQLVHSARVAAGGTTPVGASLSILATDEDLRLAVNADVDFLTLVAGSMHPAVRGFAVVDAIVRTQRLMQDCNHKVPLLVAGIRITEEQAPLLFALGVDHIAVDSVVTENLYRPEDTHRPQGMLSGIGVIPEQAMKLDKVKQAIVGLHQHLLQTLNFLGLGSLAELGPQHLKAVSGNAARIANCSVIGAQSH